MIIRENVCINTKDLVGSFSFVDVEAVDSSVSMTVLKHKKTLNPYMPTGHLKCNVHTFPLFLENQKSIP